MEVVTKKIKTGKYAGNIVPTYAYIYPVVKIEDGTVYYNYRDLKKIKPYYQQGYSFRNENSSHNLYDYTFDQFVLYDIGYMK
jgi:hypothetical protein